MTIINLLNININSIIPKEKVLVIDRPDSLEFVDVIFTSNPENALNISKKYKSTLIVYLSESFGEEYLGNNILSITSDNFVDNADFLKNITFLSRNLKFYSFENIFSKILNSNNFLKIKKYFLKAGFSINVLSEKYKKKYSGNSFNENILLLKNNNVIKGFLIKNNNIIFHVKSHWNEKSDLNFEQIINNIKKINFLFPKKEKLFTLSINGEKDFLEKHLNENYFVLNKAGNIIYVNENFKNFFDSLNDPNFQTIRNLLPLNDSIESFKNNEPFSLKVQKEFGSEKKYFEINFSPIKENGIVNNYFAIVKDITCYRKMEEELKFSNERLFKMTKVLTSIQNATIFGFAKLAEYKDEETGGHLERMQNYVKTLTTEIFKKEIFIDFKTKKNYINDNYIEEISLSSMLHDIGKMGVPDNIIHKPGRLTLEENAQMQKHTTIGGDTLKCLNDQVNETSYLSLAKEIAYFHHEKWNGKGYPYGLKEENIPISARIVSLCDVYDALTSKRSYKMPYSHEKSCEIIYNLTNTQFDPVIISVFSSIESQFKKIRQSYSN
jgi:response regulator RpfG family c-di-GMP phosphodiesterase